MASVRTGFWLLFGLPAVFAAACGGNDDNGDKGFGTAAQAGKSQGSGGKGAGGTTVISPTSGGSTGAGARGNAAGMAGADDTCTGLQYQQKTTSALDLYFVFDRTASMGDDCSYTPGDDAPVSSKACFATYAVCDYLSQVSSNVDTRLALQFMSQPDDCDGTPYETPLVPLTKLPVPTDHAMIRAISDETFAGGLGTHIEGALRGIAAFTKANRTDGREMIGVLMTDGDPQGCEENIGDLGTIIADHLAATGIRTFIIGMEGATEDNLERLASAGGAEPHSDWCGSLDAPCHYWNVENGSQGAIAKALSAIVAQAAPIPCEFAVSGFTPPAGQTLDFGKVNVTLTDAHGTETTIGQAASEAACPKDVPAWYYDDPSSPKAIRLCSNACSLVTGSATGSRVNVKVGCEDTVLAPPVK
ncbi:MAG TPA: vWA domain-containing protein [Polyangiaceae bacterium]|nr:vWA domain-containing protein [Polyangiaceae bacterium]